MRLAHHTTALALGTALVPVLLATAGCNDNPETELTAATPGVQESQDVEAEGRGPGIPFDDAEVFFEFNTTDNDLGLQVFLDADEWQRVRVADPAKKDIVDITARSGLSNLGITELRFESAEPSPAEVLAIFPPGVYNFTGKTVDGERLASTAALSHQFLAAPTISPSGGQAVDKNATVVTWNAPGADRVEIIIEQEDLGHVFDVIVSGSTTSLNVPPQFLQPGTGYKIEILAIGTNRNRTIVESTFVTM